MRYGVMALLLLALGSSCSPPAPEDQEDLEATAVRFFRSVFGCAPAGIDEWANPDVRVSYPIFQELYGTQVIAGAEAVKEFSGNFCRRWADASITIHEAISEGSRVVLVWGFGATDLLARGDGASRQSWGGISVFTFDELGRVLAEYGEESGPGPAARMATSPAR